MNSFLHVFVFVLFVERAAFIGFGNFWLVVERKENDCFLANTFSMNNVPLLPTIFDYNGKNCSIMTENRKRLREDDACEFMPLSKRINNLHINNLASGSQIQPHLVPNLAESRPNYDPGIDSSQSNYYHNNKLLFELHLERIRRTGQPYPY